MLTIDDMENMKPGSLLAVGLDQKHIDAGIPNSDHHCAFALVGKTFPGVVDCWFTAKGYFLEVEFRDHKHYVQRYVPVGREAPEFGEQFDNNKDKAKPGVYNFTFDKQHEIDPTKEYGPEKKRESKPRKPRKVSFMANVSDKPKTPRTQSVPKPVPNGKRTRWSPNNYTKVLKTY